MQFPPEVIQRGHRVLGRDFHDHTPAGVRGQPVEERADLADVVKHVMAEHDIGNISADLRPATLDLHDPRVGDVVQHVLALVDGRNLVGDVHQWQAGRARPGPDIQNRPVII
jgi:hypothetical protein